MDIRQYKLESDSLYSHVGLGQSSIHELWLYLKMTLSKRLDGNYCDEVEFLAFYTSSVTDREKQLFCVGYRRLIDTLEVSASWHAAEIQCYVYYTPCPKLNALVTAYNGSISTVPLIYNRSTIEDGALSEKIQRFCHDVEGKTLLWETLLATVPVDAYYDFWIH